MGYGLTLEHKSKDPRLDGLYSCRVKTSLPHPRYFDDNPLRGMNGPLNGQSLRDLDGMTGRQSLETLTAFRVGLTQLAQKEKRKSEKEPEKLQELATINNWRSTIVAMIEAAERHPEYVFNFMP